MSDTSSTKSDCKKPRYLRDYLLKLTSLNKWVLISPVKLLKKSQAEARRFAEEVIYREIPESTFRGWCNDANLEELACMEVLNSGKPQNFIEFHRNLFPNFQKYFSQEDALDLKIESPKNHYMDKNNNSFGTEITSQCPEQEYPLCLVKNEDKKYTS